MRGSVLPEALKTETKGRYLVKEYQQRGAYKECDPLFPALVMVEEPGPAWRKGAGDHGKDWSPQMSHGRNLQLLPSAEILSPDLSPTAGCDFVRGNPTMKSRRLRVICTSP